MYITFMSDPAACFQIAQTYLDEGPDMYTKTRLRVHVTMNYRIVDRFIILIRLHSLATKLALPGLMDMAYEVIIEGERLITPSFCIAIASVVFSPDAGFDGLLKDWCLKHVGYHFIALKDIKEWNDNLKVLEPGLDEQWSKLMGANSAILAAIEEEADEKTLEKAISSMLAEGQGNAISVIEREEMTVEEFIRKVKEDERGESDDDWEDVEELLGEEDQSSRDKKAREMLGLTPAKDKGPAPKEISMSKSRSIVTSETAKARTVMGLDASIGKAAGRKQLNANRTSKLFKLLS